MDPVTIGLLASSGVKLLGGLFGKKKAADTANKNAAAQAEYTRAEQQRQIDDRNKEAEAAEAARVARFNMGLSILRSMGDSGVSPETLNMLEATRGKANPIKYSSAIAPPVAKQPGFNFFSTLGDLGGLGMEYFASKGQANDYADEYNSHAGVTKAPALGASGQPAGTFGSSVNFTKNRKLVTQPFTFDDLYS